jgi:hypothetical protein
MMSGHDVELLARLNREEMARELASIRRATSAQRQGDVGILRRRVATVLVAVAARLAPVARPVSEVNTEASLVNS